MRRGYRANIRSWTGAPPPLPRCRCWRCWGAASPAPAAAQVLVPVDRIVAVVDEDPIFYSDLTRALAFGFARPGRVPGDLRPVLDQLVDERLRAHDIDRYGVPPAPEAEIDAQLNRIEAAHGGPAALDAELLAVGSTRSSCAARSTSSCGCSPTSTNAWRRGSSSTTTRSRVITRAS